MEVTQYYVWNSQNVDKVSTCANSGYQALFRTGLGTRLNTHMIEYIVLDAKLEAASYAE